MACDRVDSRVRVATQAIIIGYLCQEGLHFQFSTISSSPEEGLRDLLIPSYPQRIVDSYTQETKGYVGDEQSSRPLLNLFAFFAFSACGPCTLLARKFGPPTEHLSPFLSRLRHCDSRTKNCESGSWSSPPEIQLANKTISKIVKCPSDLERRKVGEGEGR